MPSLQFLIFALLGAAVFNIVRAPAAREWLWLALNLLFVWTLARAIGPLIPMAGFLVLGYLCIEGARCVPRWPAAAGTILVLACFIWLKRYSFIPPALVLPPGYLLIGFSYIFFRVMHLVIDAGQDGAEPGSRRIGILSYLNFTLNFPALLSGPIQRWEDYRAHSDQPLGANDLGTAAWRMMVGAFKVLVLSDILHTWQREVIAGLAPDAALSTRSADGALIVVLYALFLYTNFSGYTDFVIGIARLYRLRLPENFANPFRATNFIAFWNRWHISLSQWLRSYVFNPVLTAGMRRVRSPAAKQYLSVLTFLVTFFLVGAWHGPTSEFLFFGLLQGGGVASNRLYQVWMTNCLTPGGYQRLCVAPFYTALSRGLTFTWFAFTLLWFWDSWSGIARLGRDLGSDGALAAAVGTFLISSAVLAIPDLFAGIARPANTILASRYTRTALASTMFLLLIVSQLVLKLPAPEIVYKQF